MPPSGDEFLFALSDALNHLYDINRLKNSPLKWILGYPDAINSASQLQQKLLDLIREMQPPPGEPAASINHRNHIVLSLRFEQQYSQKEIARQLGLSVRQCRRAQTAAVGAMAARLWNQCGFSNQFMLDRSRGSESITIASDSVLSDHNIPRELAWIQMLPGDENADLAEVFETVFTLVDGLVKKTGVKLSRRGPDRVPSLIIHPMALRHILLDFLNLAILQAGVGSIIVDTILNEQYVELIFPIHLVKQNPELEFPEINLTTKLIRICRADVSFNEEGGTWLAKIKFPLLEQIKILVVDDIDDTLLLLKRYSTNTCYQLITTSNPTKVPALIEENQPRAIVMDIMMPEMDGWDLLTRLRENPSTKDIPILVCTVLNLRELASTLGASGFLKKPPGREEFLSALDRLVNPPLTPPAKYS